MITENDHARWRAAMDAGPPEALSDDEVDGMLAHADECADCAPALRDFAARALAAQAPPVRMEPARAASVRRRVLVGARGRAAPRARRPRYAAAYPGGWMAAAALVVALLTHHAFHEPLAAGWFAAALFALLALGLGYYALQQRRRMAELQHQLDAAADGSDGRA
jgi:hypothetical protein